MQLQQPTATATATTTATATAAGEGARSTRLLSNSNNFFDSALAQLHSLWYNNQVEDK
jgi:hypothetical protein